ncbi:aminodeoxychorismate synthase, component I [Azospira sp. I13]|uniref:aminodeoxychorismate synthase component I n=1 Tax=Azospira sp. I13 TaxID=1765050 RepID=UPI000D47A9EC|nr:aminodeoxychorismate synthase component I [Azospira sp. I13]GBG01017.1 aminodeoxychorismate synthase, component I [Azospira sp. I13]
MPLPAAFAFLEGEAGVRLCTELRSCRPLHSPADLTQALAEAEAAAAQGLWAVWALDYGLGHWLVEARQGAPSPVFGGEGSRGHLWLFQKACLLPADAAQAWLDRQLGALPADECAAGIAELQPGRTAEDYGRAVQRIRDYIAAGDCYQVNFTFPLTFRHYGHPLALYARLRQRQPTPLGGLLLTPQRQVLSLSPELFVEGRDGLLTTRPMKGTAPRGGDPAADAAARAALAASAKDRAENLMIVDLLRNDLGRLAAIGSVQVPRLFDIEAYPTVFQMTSTVTARAPQATLGDVLAALFPCGSITGAPKLRAMEIIDELEATPRGLYTGALGAVSPDGDFRFNVSIRTLELDGQGGGQLGVGSGIVIDSEPQAEYRECLLKARFLTDLDPGFSLIETLRLENGHFPDGPLHCRRLAESASALGFAHDPARVQETLTALALAHPEGDFRARLTLNKAGDLATLLVPLELMPGPWQVHLSPHRLDSRRYLLRHKTTARQLYDVELQRVMALPGGFDALFLNERGEVCEGARSNVFARIGGQLVTPPLACGLLPGILRQRLLASGAAVEGLLSLEDLQGAEALFMGNALRGLIPVDLVI